MPAPRRNGVAHYDDEEDEVEELMNEEYYGDHDVHVDISTVSRPFHGHFICFNYCVQH